MRVFEVRNAHVALPVRMQAIYGHGCVRESRNGTVRMFNTPVTIVYERPQERVIFWPQRDANPFFHFFESLWMLAGRQDVAALTPFVKRMSDYSDDGQTLHGAYGHRWRNHFQQDQLRVIAQRLKENPDDRRCVLQIWDATVDLDTSSVDLPCNTQVYFSRNVFGDLDMMVLNRSNDLIWGALGANAVHFSMLQEYMALRIGCAVGVYHQVSNNMHAYISVLEPLMKKLNSYLNWSDPYATFTQATASQSIELLAAPWPLLQPNETYVYFDQDLEALFSGSTVYASKYFQFVVQPLQRAHVIWCEMKDDPREDRVDCAQDQASQCVATDWRKACMEWLERRREVV